MRINALQVADQIKVQRGGLNALQGVDGEALDVRIGVGPLEIAEQDLLRKELLSAGEVSV